MTPHSQRPNGSPANADSKSTLHPVATRIVGQVAFCVLAYNAESEHASCG